MQNVIGVSISKSIADSGQIYTNQNGAFAVVSMGDARLFFESAGDMVSMAHLLLELAEDLAEKQKEQSNA